MSFLAPFRTLGGILAGKSASPLTSAFLRGDAPGEAGARLGRPYAQSAWVRSAVNHIAGEISWRPLKFYAGETEYEESAFTFFWDAPALGPRVRGGVQPRMPIVSVLRDLSAWATLEGEFFIILDDSWILATAPRIGGALPPFLIGNPSSMRLVVSGGELQGYDYTMPGGRRLSLVPEQVVHWKGFNPYDDWRGVGSLEAASVAAEGAFSTGVYVRDLMRNNGDQGFIVVAKSGPVSDPQREQIVADLRAKRVALKRGVAKDLFLTGDITVDRPQERAASTDLNVGKALSHQEIYVAFGVPPSMAEVKASYSIGKESDYYQLISRTCQPLGQEIAGTLAVVASRQAGSVLSAELDWDDHPVMIEVRTSRIETALKLWGVGMPIKVANDYLGLGMSEFPGWEVGYLPFSVSQVGGEDAPAPAAAPQSDQALAEAEPAEGAPLDPDLEQLRLAVLARKRLCRRGTTSGEPDFSVLACTCHASGAVAMRGRSEAEVRRWKDHMTKRLSTLRSFESAIRRELMHARAETLANLQRVQDKSIDGVVGKTAGAEVVFDKKTFKDGLTATMRKREQAALNDAGQQLFRELGRDDAWVFPPARAVQVLRERETRIAGAADEIHDRIKAVLEDGLNAGDTMDQLAAKVRSAFNGIADGKARTIAATETSVCYGVARDEAMQDAGVPFKEWLTSGNDNVRSAHAEANGQTVPVDQPFIVDGEQLMHPGDPSGTAGNVINCHCVSIAKAES